MRRLAPLLALVLVPWQLACGGRAPEGAADGGTSAEAAGGGTSAADGARASDTVELRVEGLEAGPDAYAPGARLELRLLLRNPGADTLRLGFSSGQRFDFTVRDAGGETVWRWSEGRFFTQALGSETLPPGDSVVYEAGVPEGLQPGRYTVVGRITARDRSPGDSVEVRVGGR